MQIFLVGGAVRDKLLGEPVKERDFVVVGGTPEKMLSLGYRQVGKNFPVFLHPKTHEEYALARTEHKTGKGYTQFTCHSTPDVTLEEDLKRRDLTINAMAETLDGQLIDLHDGQSDLKNHILRHVSPAFTEDPLRVLRVARFAARFGDFEIHPETMKLMQKIVAAGEIEALVTERIWRELARALTEKCPWRFFQVLKDCGALAILMPEISPHLENALKALHIATTLSPEGCVRFATMLHDLDKETAKNLYRRLRTPRTYSDLAISVINHQNDFHHALKLNTEQLVQLLEKLDAFRRKDKFQQFLLACESYSAKIPSKEIQHLNNIHQIAAQVSGKIFAERGLTGEELKKALHEERVKRITTVRNSLR